MTELDFSFQKPQRMVRFDPGDHLTITFSEKSWKQFHSQFDELLLNRRLTLEDPQETKITFVIVKKL